MRTQNEDSASGASPPVTAEKIISDFVHESDMDFFEENLHELFIEFVTSENGCDREDKDDIVYTYTSLRRLLKRIKLIENQLKLRK